ncbi:NADH-quinone oxidoreductase subunit C [Streptomyces sp. NPDC006184]|uniref:NADH-quinone oxidoreductase subunit C n=1 Tax=Streptomyces sp. NPDC006184 TaxID=3155455 RepID=UPI0033B79FB6
MSTAGWLPAPAGELFGTDATAEESYGLLTVDVPPSSWLTALETARTTLSCTYFDWLSAVDEPGTGFRVAAHVVALNPVRRLLVRTTVPHDAPALPSAIGVYAGAAWHERETHEMFGVVFEGHPDLGHLLLPENFEGHPLRKDFVLAARVAKAWPGAKEPGESEHGGPKRRQMLPPGVPDPNEWGPLKGQLPPAPARPARTAGRAATERPARAAGERPPRRTRSASEGSAGQAPGTGQVAGGEESAQAAQTGDAATRKQAAAQGDATRAAAESPAEGPAAEASVAYEPGPAPPSARPRRTRSASQGSATQRAQTPEPARSEPTEPAATEPAPTEPDAAARPAGRSAAPRSSDAPWHHARPAFDEPGQAAGPARTPGPQPEPQPQPEPPAEEPQRPNTPADPADPNTPDDPSTSKDPNTPDDPETPRDPEPDPNPNPNPNPNPRTPDHPAGGPQ